MSPSQCPYMCKLLLKSVKVKRYAQCMDQYNQLKSGNVLIHVFCTRRWNLCLRRRLHQRNPHGRVSKDSVQVGNFGDLQLRRMLLTIYLS